MDSCKKHINRNETHIPSPKYPRQIIQKTKKICIIKKYNGFYLIIEMLDVIKNQ